MTIAESSGDSTHPCFTPERMGNLREFPSAVFTQQVVSSYIAMMRFTMISVIP